MSRWVSEWRKSLSLASCNLNGIKNINMKFCNLVKFMDQYCGKKFQPCRDFQYEVTEVSKWPELFHVKGSLAVHAPSFESNLAGALPCPKILCSYMYGIHHVCKKKLWEIVEEGILSKKDWYEHTSYFNLLLIKMLSTLYLNLKSL